MKLHDGYSSIRRTDTSVQQPTEAIQGNLSLAIDFWNIVNQTEFFLPNSSPIFYGEKNSWERQHRYIKTSLGGRKPKQPLILDKITGQLSSTFTKGYLLTLHGGEEYNGYKEIIQKLHDKTADVASSDFEGFGDESSYLALIGKALTNMRIQNEFSYHYSGHANYSLGISDRESGWAMGGAREAEASFVFNLTIDPLQNIEKLKFVVGIVKDGRPVENMARETGLSKHDPLVKHALRFKQKSEVSRQKRVKDWQLAGV